MYNKSLFIKSACAVLCAAMLASAPLSAYAAAAVDTDLHLECSIQNRLPDSDILLEGYLDRAAGIPSEENAKLPHSSGRKQLDAAHTAICEILGESIKKIAAGELSNTSIAIYGDEIFNRSGAEFTIRDLDINAIINALIDEYPYELYWFDKTNSIEAEGYRDITFSFPVSSDYSLSGDIKTFSTDTSKTSAAKRAAENAKRIVDRVDENSSDYSAMRYFKDQICSMTTYSREASENHMDYGDPWQLIYVFDGDSSTNVVCEGYSKAFKFLCDLYDFNSDITCITATGDFSYNGSSESHMWNIVSISGNNYLVDITNSDDDSVGRSGELFFAYAPANRQLSYTNGMYAGVDVLVNGLYLRYVYDISALNTYDESELKISESPLVVHNVIWENSDGLIYEEDADVADGELPVYNGAVPAAADGSTFEGWTPNTNAPIYSSDETVRFTASFKEKKITHVVNFVLDGELLNTTEVTHGQSIGIVDVSVENCTFAGWYSDPELTQAFDIKSRIIDDIDIYAKVTFHAVWKDSSGKILEERDVLYGTIPTYSGGSPAMPADDQYEYVFAGWIPSTTEPNVNIEYTQYFEQYDRYYTVRWLNADCSVLESAEYKFGETPEYNGTVPSREQSDDYVYTFAGWTPKISPVSKNKDYVAVFDRLIIDRIYGDVDGDGSIDSFDALRILRSSVGLDRLEGDDRICADVNGDAIIDSSDAVAVLRYSVGLNDNETVLGSKINK